MGERLDHLLLWLGGRWDSWSRPPESVRGQDAAFLLEPGARVGSRYRLVRVLGEGGMGRVWLAEDEQARREVALKELRRPAGLSAGEAEASALGFRREFFAMRRLRHPNTVEVYDSGTLETGDRYLTMEVVGGRDLSDWVKEGPLPSEHVFKVLLELTGVLSFIHSRLFVHSDIKADNIRLTDRGAVKLMDFGLMHQLGTPAAKELKGTPSYMAPEWPQGGIIDGRSDLYSLGVLAFYLATGRFPFRGRTLGEVLEAHVQTPPPRPSLLAPVDPKLEKVILRLLEKRPKDRYPDARAVAVALAEASGRPLPEEPVAARASYLNTPELVGREAEWAKLEAALSLATRGAARALFVGADPGVGKSRLLRELELKVTLAGHPVGLGQCRPEGLAPLAPLVSALTKLLPVTPPYLLDKVRDRLQLLFPNLPGARPPATSLGEDPKVQLFSALAEWLGELGRQRPFVLCLEDLHWADSATFEHMNVVVRALAGTRGLFVATFRPSELDRLSIAFQTVEEGLSDRLEVLPLSAAKLGELVQRVLDGYEVPERFAQNLHGLTRGNAYFAMECLRLFIEAGVLNRKGGQWASARALDELELPPSLDETIARRLSSCAGPSLDFLKRAAPAGLGVDLPLLRALFEGKDERLFELLEELVERQFLQYQEGRYYFAHNSLLSCLEKTTPEAERKVHHRRLGEYLEKRFADDPTRARQVGFHFARSDEPRRAIRPLLRAGEEALAAKLSLEATFLLREASTLLEATPDFPECQRLLATTWGRLVEAGFNGHPPSCVEYSRKLFSHWEARGWLGEGSKEVRSRWEKADTARDASRQKLVRALLQEVEVDEPMKPLSAFLKYAELRVVQVGALGAMGRVTEVEAELSKVAEDLPQGMPQAAASQLGKWIASGHLGRFELLASMREAVNSLRRARAEVGGFSRRLSWSLGLADYLLNQYLGTMGAPLEAEATREGLSLAQENAFSDIHLHHLNTQLTRACFSGDGALFSRMFSEVSEHVRRLGKPRLLDSRILLFVPIFYLERREPELAAAAVARLENFSALLPMDKWLALYARVYRAAAHVLAAEWDQAETTLAAAEAASLEAGFRMATLAQVYRSKVATVRGKRAEAVAGGKRALARATDPALGNPFDEILARRALAETGGPDAEEHLVRAAALAQKNSIALQEGAAKLALADLLLSSRREEAAQLVLEAEECFARSGATRWQEQVQRFRLHAGGTQAS